MSVGILFPPLISAHTAHGARPAPSRAARHAPALLFTARHGGALTHLRAITSPSPSPLTLRCLASLRHSRAAAVPRRRRYALLCGRRAEGEGRVMISDGMINRGRKARISCMVLGPRALLLSTILARSGGGGAGGRQKGKAGKSARITISKNGGTRFAVFSSRACCAPRNGKEGNNRGRKRCISAHFCLHLRRRTFACGALCAAAPFYDLVVE